MEVHEVTLEISVETHLMNVVHRMGGRCLKLNAEWSQGVPDRLCILPEGQTWFIETKRPKGGKLSRMQLRWKETLAELDHNHAVLSSRGAVDLWAAALETYS